MGVLTGDQSAAARAALGLSQSKVAKEVGMNRTYLCQFESGKRIISDEQQRILLEYFKSLGWKPEPAAPDAGGGATGLHPDVSIVDGFAVANADYQYNLEDLLDECQENLQVIREEMSKKLPRGFLGGLDHDEALKACSLVLGLLAVNAEAVMIMHGAYEPPSDGATMSDDSSLQTVGDYVFALMSQASPRRPRVMLDEPELEESA